MIERAVDRGELDRAADPALVVDVSGTVSRPSGRSVVPQRSPSKYRSPVPVALHGSG